MKFVLPEGSREVIAGRMRARPGHYMQPGMLDSQFETLEEPRGGMTVDIRQTPEGIIRQVIEYFGL